MRQDNIRYTLRRSSGLAYEKTQSAYGLNAFFLRHIFAVAGNLRFPLSQPQKRRIAFTLCDNFLAPTFIYASGIRAA
ncbi:hypothetical protein FACS1894190_07250 [Spirochaetia bacterium]|nr:hypothetical protein FACS1894190_07250 [Spirochaetia bacterium]